MQGEAKRIPRPVGDALMRPAGGSLIEILPDDLKEGMTPGETRLLECAERGEMADLRSTAEAENDPAASDMWGPERSIRAAFMHWLCTSPEAAPRIHTKGIRVRGARIRGSLDFEGATVLHRLFILDSALTDGIILVDARTRRLALEGSYTPRLLADRLSADGDLELARLRCGRAVLLGADIKGQLICRGGRFENPKGNALLADGATVQGDVFLSEGFHATGEVRLLGADIKGQLTCSGGRFENPEGNALSVERATVDGTAFLRRCRLEGTLNLGYARFGVIVDDAESWPDPGRLVLEGLEYEGFGGLETPVDARQRIHWLRRQSPTPFHPQPYDQLAKVLRRMGREGDVAEVMIAKQQDLIQHGGLGYWAKAVRRLLGLTTGHGYQTWRAVLGALVLFVIGALLFGWADSKALMVPSSAEILVDPSYVQKRVIPSGYPRFSALAYAADALLPIVDLHQEGFWLPDAGTRAGAFVQVCLWVHIVAGWVLSTLFAAGVTGLVRRLE
jgi:hypothetical protein